MSQAAAITMDDLITAVAPIFEPLGAAITVESATVLNIEDLPERLHHLFGRMEIQFTEKGPRIEFGRTPFKMEAFSLDEISNMAQSEVARHIDMEENATMTFSQRIQKEKNKKLEPLKDVGPAVEVLRKLYDAINPDLAALGFELTIMPLLKSPWAELRIQNDDKLAEDHLLRDISPITFIKNDSSTGEAEYKLPRSTFNFGLSSTINQIAEQVGDYLAKRDTITNNTVMPTSTGQS